MNDKQENKMTMYEAVKTLLDANSAKTATIAAFAPAYANFTGFITQIKAKDVEKGVATTGKTSNKRQARENLINELYPIASSIAALGAATNDNTLKEAGAFGRSALVRQRDTQLTNTAQTIHGLANTNAAALVAYNVTAGMIASLDTRITEYTNSLGVREASVGQRSAAGKQVDNIMKKADKVLKEQLDKMMEGYYTADLQFYNEYKTARQIIDLKGGGGQNPPAPPNP